MRLVYFMKQEFLNEILQPKYTHTTSSKIDLKKKNDISTYVVKLIGCTKKFNACSQLDCRL